MIGKRDTDGARFKILDERKTEVCVNGCDFGLGRVVREALEFDVQPFSSVKLGQDGTNHGAGNEAG